MKKIKRPLSTIPSALKNINLQAVMRSRGIYVQQHQNKALKAIALPLARKYMAGKKTKAEPKRHAQFDNDTIMAYWEKQIHIVDIIESRFEKKVEQFVTKIVDGYLKHLDQEAHKGYFDDNADDFLVQAQLDFTPLLMDQVVLAGQEAYKLVGVTDVYLPGKLRERIQENVAKFTQSMLDTDRDTLVRILTEGLSDGKSIPEIRGQIVTSFDDISKNQAQRITRTEVLRASNQASIDAYEQSGVVEGKQWLTAGAVDECAEFEGQVVGLSSSFYGGEDDFRDGDPPLHPNCRCVVLPVLVGEKGITAGGHEKLVMRIKELEEQIDKRTKAFKDLQDESTEGEEYIKELERLIDERDA